MIEHDRPQMTIEYTAENMGLACQQTKARLQTHTFLLLHIYCLFTRTRLHIAIYVLCLYGSDVGQFNCLYLQKQE
jgi:hypothetical protein